MLNNSFHRGNSYVEIYKDKLGGSIKSRLGVKAIRWRLYNKNNMIDLVNRVNGHIKHSNRLLQLNRVCANLNIELRYYNKLS